MARFGSLNRAAQRAYYNALANATTSIKISPSVPPTTNSEVGIRSGVQPISGQTKINTMRRVTGACPPRYPLQDSESGSLSGALVTTAVGPKNPEF